MRSPAFQFYPNDFLGSAAVQGMTAEHIGAYLLLLCLDWNGDGFTFGEKKLAKICRLTPKRFAAAWTDICGCFALGEDGRYRNARLQRERTKQLAYSERMSNNGKKGGRPKAVALQQLSDEKAVAKPNESIQLQSHTLLPTTTTKTTTTTTTAPNPTAPAAKLSSRSTPRAPTPPPPPSWLSVVAGSYELTKGAGSFPHGKAGKTLKPLHEAGHTGEEIALRLTRYMAWLDDAKFFSFQRFRETFGDYEFDEPAHLRALAGYPNVVDEYGCWTEYGDRVTSPDRKRATR